MSIGDEDRSIVTYYHVGGRVEVGTTPSRNPGRAEGQQDPTSGTEFDDLLSPRSFRCSPRGHSVRHPHVSVRIHIDAVGPDEHASAEALDGITFGVELDDRVQIRIEALAAEAIGPCITPHYGPDMLTIVVDRHISDGPHLPPRRKLGPTVDRAEGTCPGLGGEPFSQGHH